MKNENLFESDFKELNRYLDIKPYKYNSIIISTKNGYINASPISIRDEKNLFIATQGPMPHTVEDFWTMVYQLKSEVIIMLCNLIEGGKEKCVNYLKAKMNKFEVKVKEEKNCGMYYKREIQLINLLNKEKRSIFQIHFMNWPDDWCT